MQLKMAAELFTFLVECGSKIHFDESIAMVTNFIAMQLRAVAKFISMKLGSDVKISPNAT